MPEKKQAEVHCFINNTFATRFIYEDVTSAEDVFNAMNAAGKAEAERQGGRATGYDDLPAEKPTKE